ncbi:flagellar protein FlgN [Paenibacillus sp. D51F]
MRIEDIIATLEDQQALYSQLNELAEEKTPALVKGDLDVLNKILMKERKLTKTAEELETRRMTQVNIHFSRLQLRLRTGRLSDLIRTISNPEDKQRLAEIQNALSVKLEQLKMKNDHNQQLAEQAVSFVNYSIELLSVEPEQDYIYKHPMNSYGEGKFMTFNTKG